MTAFRTPLDIANRSLSICRADRITTFGDYSVGAVETGLHYEEARQEELRANRWRFSIKRTVIRAVDSTTLIWTPPTWAAPTTYRLGQVVVGSDGEWYQSRASGNTGNDPTVPTVTLWEQYSGPDSLELADTTGATHYFPGELVSQGGIVYLSLTADNTDTPPTANWLEVDGTTSTLEILYPIATGPRTDFKTQNVFRLPHGFLRQAPSNPKGDLFTVVGSAAGPSPEDWLFEDNYIVSAQQGPIMLRYISDISDVKKMDSLFCESLAGKLAKIVAPRVSKPEYVRLALQNAQSHYDTAIKRAGEINGIEVGFESPPIDQYILVRY